MISLEHIKNFYPASISGNAVYLKYILKEYIQLLVLDYLSSTKHVRKITFIGGTNLRLVKGIDRFSEDLDFDCKNLSGEEFVGMADDVMKFLRRNGFNVEAKDKAKGALNAFRYSIHFPQLLFDMGVSGHKEERFMIKLEAQDQGIEYKSAIGHIKGCGFYFTFPIPPDEVLCAMKIAAMLSRSKGRDYYDLMLLLSQTKPDYEFLGKRSGIGNLQELKDAIEKSLQTIDLGQKQKDFEHLLFNRDNSNRILRFRDFIRAL